MGFSPNLFGHASVSSYEVLNILIEKTIVSQGQIDSEIENREFAAK